VNERHHLSEIKETESHNELGGPETILLVEDEAAVRRATAEFLRLQGYNVIEARDGVDALALAQEQTTIHLVVSDVVMPRMSGGALAKEVARVRPDTQFLFVSGYAGKPSSTPRWSIWKRTSCRNLTP
jgi:CheY-like chemotaxis protein